MVYCINLIHSGVFGALLAFFLWSLPGALGMFALSIGVSNIDTALPRAVYALLSGLNAATVGIIALAAVELSNKAITDRLTRIIVFVAAAAGLLYNALWYFPALMFAAGFAAVVHDFRWLHRLGRFIKSILTSPSPSSTGVGNEAVERDGWRGSNNSITAITDPQRRTIPQEYRLNFSWKAGAAVIATFLAAFTVIMVLRGVLHSPSMLYKLFANLCLAGTVIFGGGPVVIPPAAGICRGRRMGQPARLSYRARHHPSVSRTEFQLCRIPGSPRRDEQWTTRHSWSHHCVSRHLLARDDLGPWHHGRLEGLEKQAMGEIRVQRYQCRRSWFHLYSRVPNMASWICRRGLPVREKPGR
ncbi:uncharacterized protein TrAtP1_003293 [Trichoderma atroviride]|nr:hypothetical protein TrAtP1_003293 [Trichoderma atroviride]